MKIQISTCIWQPNQQVLEEWLKGIAGLDISGLDVSYSFILHNPLGYEKGMFAKYLPSAELESVVLDLKPAQRGSYTHFWGKGLPEFVGSMKDRLIEKAIENESSIFFCDSDQVLRPETLQQLVSTGQDIVGEILWTRWKPQDREMPNCWDYDDYIIRPGALEEWEKPGIYQVGFIGGLLLASFDALKAGVRYAQVHNLNFWGEDRHFGVRAAVLGYDMWIDTHYPAFHIYRDSDLERLPGWLAS